MDVKKIIFASVIIWIVGSIVGMLTCGWLFNWVYMLPPLIWKDPKVMLAPINMLASYSIGLISAIIFTSVYSLIKNAIPGTGIKKGAIYGMIIWAVGALTGISIMPIYMTIATTVVVYWILQALAMNMINGAIVAAIIKD